MVENTLLTFSLPSVQRKKVTAAFDAGRMTSDGDIMLLAAIENSLGVATKLASVIADPRNPAFVSHSVADIVRGARRRTSSNCTRASLPPIAPVAAPRSPTRSVSCSTQARFG